MGERQHRSRHRRSAVPTCRTRPAASGRAALGQPARRRRPPPGAGRPRAASTASRCATGRSARAWCWRPWTSPSPPAASPSDLRRRQVLRLAERAESVYRHNLQTARLAARLFDVTASLHGLGSREREWLEYAALLHDIGYSIHYRGHHKHAYYLITNAVLDAFDQREIEIIAHVARYHRGRHPQGRPSDPRRPQALAAAHHPQARRPAARGRRP